MNKIILNLLEKIIALLLPLIIKLVIKMFEEKRAKTLALNSLKKAIDEKNTIDVERIINSL